MDDDLRKLAEATVACLGPRDEPSTKHHLARAYLRLLEEREEVLLKDRGKTREINVLTGENRALRAERDEARGLLLEAWPYVIEHYYFFDGRAKSLHDRIYHALPTPDPAAASADAAGEVGSEP